VRVDCPIPVSALASGCALRDLPKREWRTPYP
jgi:hypothetical protein